jgi:uncharacterized linocin/CFP29 family protein
MNHLLRGHAPLTEAAWAAIDEEAKARLTTNLAARKLVDFSGPHGWGHSATVVGRTAPLSSAPGDGVAARTRRVLPLVELRAPFSLDRDELSNVDRGAVDVDLDGLDAAAREIATTENAIVFHGYPEAGIVGIIEASAHPSLPLSAGTDDYPATVAKAVAALRGAGIAGPYGLAVSPEIFTRIAETAEHGGYLLLDHLKHILDGPLLPSPGLSGGVVLSLRGGDFILESGQDLSVGYTGHTHDSVELYLEESLTFRVTEPDAAVVLTA